MEKSTLLILSLFIFVNSNTEASMNTSNNTLHLNTVNRKSNKKISISDNKQKCYNQQKTHNSKNKDKSIYTPLNNVKLLENKNSKNNRIKIFKSIDAYKLKYAINHPNDLDPDKSIQNKIDKLQTPRDIYIAPEVYDEVMVQRMINDEIH